jgi:integrase
MLHGFFGEVPEAFCQPLYEAAAILLDRLRAVDPDRAKEALALLQTAAPAEAARAGAVPVDALSQALDDTMKRLKGDLKDAPVAAMLAARPKEPTAASKVPAAVAALRRQRAHRLTAHVLAAILVRHRINPLESCIAAAADAMRLLKLRDIALLDDLEIDTADGRTTQRCVADCLAQAETRYRTQVAAARQSQDRASERAAIVAFRSIRNRLTDIDTVLRAAITRRPTITRTYRGRVQTVRAPMVSFRYGAVLEQVIDLVETEDDADLHDLSAPGVADQADAMPLQLHVSRAADSRAYDDLADDQRKTRMAARAEATRALALPADYDALTDHEARTLVAAALENPGEVALQVALAMLVFGRSDRRIVAIPFEAGRPRPAGQVAADDSAAETAAWRLIHGRLHLAQRVALPACKADVEVLGAFTPKAAQDEVLLQPAPPGLSPRALKDPPDTGALLRALARLRGKVARPYSRGRIAAHKQLWLRRTGADSAAIGLLCGLDPRQTAPMHYVALPLASLAELHARYLQEALGLDQPPLRITGMMGSQVRPDPLLMRAVIRTLARRLAVPLSPGATLAAVAAAHDLVVCYTLLTLMTATAHRPVSAPFEQLGDFDLDTGLVWMSDKRTRAGRSSRIAWLPPTALAQLKAYLRHLEALDVRLLPYRPDTVRSYLRPARKAEVATPQPLFFFLDADGSIVPATVEAMGDRLAGILPIQLNWPRHVLRSWLAAADADAQATDALFGHVQAGTAPLGRHSALRLDDLRPPSAHAAALLDHLGFTVLESPL